MSLSCDFLLTVSWRWKQMMCWPERCTVSSIWACLWQGVQSARRRKTVCYSVWAEIQPQQNAKWILLILVCTFCLSCFDSLRYKLSIHYTHLIDRVVIQIQVFVFQIKGEMVQLFQNNWKIPQEKNMLNKLHNIIILTELTKINT